MMGQINEILARYDEESFKESFQNENNLNNI